MSRVDRLCHRPRGGASRRLASPIRRLFGGLTITLLIAACAARTAAAQPAPDTPADALAFFQWCWQNRDVAHYHEVFADNFQYYFDYENPAGIPYLATPWSRTDELASATDLFAGGGALAPASSVTFAFTSGPNLQPPGPGYPWHQQLVAQWTLDVTCTDGTTHHGEGLSRWFVVRGDSAQIPQELKDRGFLPDSSRWYVERWLEEDNTRPIVVAPSQVNATIGNPITLQVTAQDPNGEPINSLTALSGLEGTFSVGSTNASGTYFFTPLAAGTYALGFEAVNSLIGVATTFITVAPGNVPPVASLVLKPGGAGPTSVTADGSGSHDVDGQIVSYRFDFGDGTVVGPQPLPTATHVYLQGGNWPITLMVTDNGGVTSSVTVRDSVVGLPTASLVVSPTSGVAPLFMTADGSHSSGPRPIVSYRFDFGDGTVVGPGTSTSATHTYTRGGIWPVTLMVTDNAGASASTTVSDTAIVAPVASLLMFPNSGVAPLQVTADASHSTGTGPIVSFRFDFGDGTVVGPQTNGTATHTYAVGNWVASVRITDSHGATATASTSVNVAASDPLGQLANLCKNPSFEVNTAGWESFYGSTIAIVPGGHDGSYALQMTGTTAVDYGFGVNDHPDWVHPTTAAGRTYRYSAWVRSASSQGTARIRVREYLLSSAALLGQISSPAVRLTPDWQQLVVDYTNVSVGSSLDLQVKDNPLVANEVFVTDDISIKDITGVAGITAAQGGFDPDADSRNDYDGEPLAFRSTLFPSPIQTSAVLSFATTRPGALRVDILDLAGREVRHVDEEANAPAGAHAFTIGRTGDDGQRISPGLYFYRIVADEGRMIGRFVLLR